MKKFVMLAMVCLIANFANAAPTIINGTHAGNYETTTGETAIISGANIQGSLLASGDSLTNMYDGYITQDLYAYDDSIVHIYGGTIGGSINAVGITNYTQSGGEIHI
jgi:hypothetical protein